MRHGRTSGHDFLFLFWRTEKEGESNGRRDGGAAWDQEQALEVHDSVRPEKCLANQLWPRRVGYEWPKPKNHQVEQSLSAGARILREKFIHENVDGGEKERVADAVENLHENDQ